MKKLIAIAVVAAGCLAAFAENEVQCIYWQVSPGNVAPAVGDYDQTFLYAQLGSGGQVLVGMSEQGDVSRSGTSDMFRSAELKAYLGASDLSGYSFWAEVLYGGQAVGKSDVLSYAQMVAANNVSSWSGGSSIPVQGVWNPSFTAVPEPTSGLLTLLGLAGLALRRRRV